MFAPDTKPAFGGQPASGRVPRFAGKPGFTGKRARRGFALPMAVLALALITASVIAAFSATAAETTANNSMRAQDHAYQLAEAGLQQFMLRRGEAGFCTNCVLDPALVDSEYTKVSLTGGYANVVATRIRPKLADGSPALFFIRSTGVDTMVKMSGAGSAVFATRTVGEYASFGTSSVKAMAAWVSLLGFTNNANGQNVPIGGADECGATAGVAGLVIPSGGQYRGAGKKPTGTPATDSSMSLDSLKKRVGIDWNAIINFEAIPADITLPGGTFPSVVAFSDSSFWPVIRVKSNNYTVPRDGRGIIIADSNLIFSNNNVWDGIVLVGGKLTSSGSDTTSGVTLSGLNVLLPGAVNPANGTSVDDDVVSNTKRFAYNSCKAARAAERLKVYFAWQNTWIDNVAIW